MMKAYGRGDTMEAAAEIIADAHNSRIDAEHSRHLEYQTARQLGFEVVRSMRANARMRELKQRIAELEEKLSERDDEIKVLECSLERRRKSLIDESPAKRRSILWWRKAR